MGSLVFVLRRSHGDGGSDVTYNLLDLLRNQFSGDVITRVATVIGENENATERALGGAIPAVLGRLVSMTSSDRGRTDLFHLLRGAGLDGSRTGATTEVLGSTRAVGDMVTTGRPLVSTLFGTHQDTAHGWLSTLAGIRRQSAGTLLGLVVPFVMDFVSKQVVAVDGSLSPRALAGLLAGQAAFLQGLPAGLAPGGAVAPRVIETPVTRPATPPAPACDEPRTEVGWLKWALPFAVLAAIMWTLLHSVTIEPAEATMDVAPTAVTTVPVSR